MYEVKAHWSRFKECNYQDVKANHVRARQYVCRSRYFFFFFFFFFYLKCIYIDEIRCFCLQCIYTDQTLFVFKGEFSYRVGAIMSVSCYFENRGNKLSFKSSSNFVSDLFIMRRSYGKKQNIVW